MTKVKYEYDVIDAQHGYVIAEPSTRQSARQWKKELEMDYPKQKFAIVQRKYKLEMEKTVR